MTIYAYLDAGGFVRQWTTASAPSPVEGLTLHQLLPGETMQERLRMVGGALVPYAVEVPLDEVRAGAIADANAVRDRRMAAFDRFTHDGVLYDGDSRSEASIALAASRAVLAGATDLMWRAFDNSDRLLSPSQVLALQAALVEAKARRATELHEACCALKAALLSATTVDEIRAAVVASNHLEVQYE